MSRRSKAIRRKKITNVIKYLLLVLVFVWTLFPVFWMINTSFRAQNDAMAIPPNLLSPLTLDNYIYDIQNTPILQNLGNSAIVIFTSIGLSALIGVPAAYALGRITFRGSRNIAFWILSTRMTSRIAIIIPLFLTWLSLGLLETNAGNYIAISLTYLTFNLPLVVWMMRGFFEDIRKDIEEAAMLDGCSRLGSFTKIVFPLAMPGLVATIIVCFIFSWNEFFFAFLLSKSAAQTAPVAVLNFYNSQGILWGRMCAASVLVMAPVMIFALIIRKYMITGLTFGVFKAQ